MFPAEVIEIGIFLVEVISRQGCYPLSIMLKYTKVCCNVRV